MRPTSLAIRGLKSWDDKGIELGPLTAIQGPNGAGKTAIIQAVRLALLGYDPETGKKLSATRKIVSEDLGEADIGLSFDTGFGIRRTFGAKTQTQVMPSQGESTGAECQARIDKETGGLVVVLDLAEYLSLSDGKRQEWLFSHLPRESAELEPEEFELWTGGTEGLEDVIANLWRTSVQAAPNPVIGLGNAIEVAHRDSIDADKAKKSQGTVTERADRRFRDLETPETVETATYEDALSRVASLNQRIGQARAGREAGEAVAARAQRLREGLAVHERHQASIAEVMKDLEAQLEAAPVPEKVAEAEARLLATVDELDVLDAAQVEATAAARDGVALFARKKGELAALEEHGPCPHASAGCTTDLQGILATRAAELGGAIEEARVSHELAAVAQQEATDALGALKGERATLARKVKDAEDRAFARSAITMDIADKETRLAELAERVDLARGELKEAETEEQDIAADDEQAGLYTDREAGELEVTRLNRLRETLAAYEAVEEALVAERESLEALTTKAAALKELVGNLRRLRAHVIKRMIEPLHEEANQILRAIDPAKGFRFVFERENKGIMDFGFEEDGVLRLYDAASKGERVMLTIAFIGALLAVLKPPMRLLVIDDLEQLWPSNRARLMAALVTLQDRWDAVIVAGACDFGDPDGWTLVKLGEVEAAA